jgi:hypothetical protein
MQLVKEKPDELVVLNELAVLEELQSRETTNLELFRKAFLSSGIDWNEF